MRLEPLVGIAVIEPFEKSFQQFVATWIRLLQVGYVGKRVGKVAASAPRYANFRQYAPCFFKHGNSGIGLCGLCRNGSEKACCASSYNRNVLHLLYF